MGQANRCDGCHIKRIRGEVFTRQVADRMISKAAIEHRGVEPPKSRPQAPTDEDLSVRTWGTQRWYDNERSET
jgi:hypothetical protein